MLDVGDGNVVSWERCRARPTASGRFGFTGPGTGVRADHAGRAFRSAAVSDRPLRSARLCEPLDAARQRSRDRHANSIRTEHLIADLEALPRTLGVERARRGRLVGARRSRSRNAQRFRRACREWCSTP